MRNGTTERLVLLDSDATRLSQIFNGNQSASRQYSAALRDEIAKAQIVPREKLPVDVVIMNSTVQIQDMEDGETITYTLVYPWEADADSCRISILAPVGTALIGYKKGDEIEWKVPSGMRKFKIISVEQP